MNCYITIISSNRISNPTRRTLNGWLRLDLTGWTGNADGRQDSSEVCRVSGKVDAGDRHRQNF